MPTKAPTVGPAHRRGAGRACSGYDAERVAALRAAARWADRRGRRHRPVTVAATPRQPPRRRPGRAGPAAGRRRRPAGPRWPATGTTATEPTCRRPSTPRGGDGGCPGASTTPASSRSRAHGQRSASASAARPARRGRRAGSCRSAARPRDAARRPGPTSGRGRRVGPTGGVDQPVEPGQRPQLERGGGRRRGRQPERPAAAVGHDALRRPGMGRTSRRSGRADAAGPDRPARA